MDGLDMTKLCLKCGHIKPLNAFYWSGDTRCQECHRAYAREYARSHPCRSKSDRAQVMAAVFALFSYSQELPIPRSYRVAYIANATSFTRNLLLAFLLCTPKGGLPCGYGLTGSASEDHQGDYGCEESKTKGHYQYYTHPVLA